MNFSAKCIVSVAMLVAPALTTSSAIAGSPQGGKGNSMGRSMSRSSITASMNHGGSNQISQFKSGQFKSGTSILGNGISTHSPGGSSFNQFSTNGTQQSLPKFKSYNSAGSLSAKFKPLSNSTPGMGNLNSKFDKTKLSANIPGLASKLGKSGNGNGNGNKSGGNSGKCGASTTMTETTEIATSTATTIPWPLPPYCGSGCGVPYNSCPQVIVVETQPVIVPVAGAASTDAVVLAVAEEEKLPSVPAAATLTISGTGFGQETGEVVLQVTELTMTVEIVKWENEKVTITVPRLGVVAPTKAKLHLLTAEGKLAKSVPFELVAAAK